MKGKKQKKVNERIKAAGNPNKMADLFNWLEFDREDEHRAATGIMLDKAFFCVLIEPQKWIEFEVCFR
ncbi:hypothetical protein V2J09_000896 [Rumex salicifolius]